MKFFCLKKSNFVLFLLILSIGSAYAASKSTNTTLGLALGINGSTGTSTDIVLGNNDFSFNWTERNLSDSKPEKPDELGYDNVDPGLEQPFMLRSTTTQKNAIVPDLFFSRVITR